MTPCAPVCAVCPHGRTGWCEDCPPRHTDLLGGWVHLGPHRTELARLTRALHASCAHPDWRYCETTGGTPTPPTPRLGRGWQPNPEHPWHGVGDRPHQRRWMWRRPQTEGDLTCATD